MVNDFGPWATTLDTGPRARLGTFWKRRMALLPFARNAGPRPSGRAAAVLVLFAALTLAAPMLSLSLLPAASPDVAQDAKPAPVNTAPASTVAAGEPAAAAEAKVEKLPDGIPVEPIPVPGTPNKFMKPIGLAEVTVAPLLLGGIVALDPNRLASVHSQFSGDVTAIGQIHDKLAGGAEGAERDIQQGDRVAKGQLLAVVWSTELGEKKSDLADAISAKYSSEEELKRLKGLGSSQDQYTSIARNSAAQKQVELDDAAVQKVVRALRMWRVPKEEIDSVRHEVEKRREQDVKSPDFGENWARFEVRAPLAGVVLEKNVAVSDVVDAKFTMFKIADLTKLFFNARVPEQYISELNALPPERRRWSIRRYREPNSPPVDGYFATIGETINEDATAIITSMLDNENGSLRPGQSVSARIVDPQIHGPGVAIPPGAFVSTAVPGNTGQGWVWLETDAAKPGFVGRPVQMFERLPGMVVCKSMTSDPNPNTDPLRPGARVVVWGPAEAPKQTAKPAPPVAPSGKPGTPGQPGLAVSTPADKKPAQTIKGVGTVIDPDGDCQVKQADGRVTIVVPKTWHDLTHTKNYSKLNSPRVMQDIKGDFWLADKVEVFESPTGKASSGGIVAFVSSGLLIWQDDDNFIRLDRAAYGNGLYVWVERFQDGKPVVQLHYDIEDEDTYLRVTRTGDRFTYATSQDGKVWVEILAEVTKMAEQLKVGVSAINSTAEEFSVRIEDLKLRQSSE